MNALIINEKTNWRVEKTDINFFLKETQRSIHTVFNKAEFSELNKNKVDEIEYLLIYKKNSPRFAITFGRKKDTLSCPFSAPFGYMELLKGDMTVSDFEEAEKALEQYFDSIGIRKAMIVFPPSFYDHTVTETWINVLFNQGWRAEYIDLNFGFHIPEVIVDYENKIKYNARKNLRIAYKAQLGFRKCMTNDEKKEAYEVIRQNRLGKGYPLKMTLEQVLAAIEVVPSDMYLVTHGEKSIAAALVYEVTQKAAQVIYWGDIPGYSDKKTINFLSYELLKVYEQKGFEYLDIGPSTEFGLPNYGLCDFKDSIGCERTTKIRMSKCFNKGVPET